MPAIQTSYSLTHAPLLEGMQVNSEPVDIVSRLVDPVGGIGFGKVVVVGSYDNSIRLPSATAAPFEGVTVASYTTPPNPTTPDTYAQYATAAVMKKGVIGVICSGSVTKGAPAYFTSAGAITATATSNTAIPNATFDSSGASGAVVKLRLA